MDVAGWSCS